MNNEQLIFFHTQGGETKKEVWLANESVWPVDDQMAELFRSIFNYRIRSVIYEQKVDTVFQ